ncbi:MAG: DUF2179 domain-containing protein [Bacteroidota bacterium]
MPSTISFFEFLPVYLIPIVIFLSRIADVSLGTLRIIFVSRGMKAYATLLGFFEVLIWIVVVTEVLQNLNSGFNLIAYAAGFAAGNYVGITIESKIKLGMLIYRIITPKEASEMVEKLRELGFGVTSVDGQGKEGNVKVIFTIIRRKQWPLIQEVIDTYVPKAFYSVEEVKHVSQIPSILGRELPRQKPLSQMLRMRKRK